MFFDHSTDPMTNPYESPNADARRIEAASYPQTVNVVWGLLGFTGGGIAGWISALIMWLVFYSYESTVIEEELYESGPPPFQLNMAIFCGIAGLIYGSLYLHRTTYAVATHIAFGLFVAFVCGGFGWYWTQCLQCVVVSQLPIAIVCFAVLSFRCYHLRLVPDRRRKR